MNEPQLKSYLLQYFGKDFIVRDEVEGNFLVDGTPVKIDYLMYPSEKLIEQGFAKEWFGVEVKAIGESPKKDYRLLGKPLHIVNQNLMVSDPLSF